MVSAIAQNPLHALAYSALMALSGCASQSLSPTSAVPTPPSETSAMQSELLSQYPTIQRMACLSSAAYVGQDNNADFCRSWTQGPYMRVVSVPVALIDLKGRPYNSYYIVWTDDRNKQQVVAIRGTDDLQDWEANLLFEPVPDKILKVFVHEGFSKYAQAVHDNLTTANQNLLNPQYETYVTGHSLGGAVAVLTALYFYVEQPNRYRIKGVYTFGQPRVFDTRGATSWPAFAQNVYHLENCYDPVPLVPVGYDILHSLIINPLDANAERRQYQHMGHEVLLLNPGEFWMTDGSDIVRNLQSDVQVTLTDVKTGQPIDHGISAYITRIQQLRGNDGHSNPMPVNPAYLFPQHCMPFSAQS